METKELKEIVTKKIEAINSNEVLSKVLDFVNSVNDSSDDIDFDKHVAVILDEDLELLKRLAE